MPVESIDLLRVRPDGIYLDATAGLGGHTGLIARQLTTGAVIANDHDTRSLEMARANTAPWADRICFHYGGFGSLAEAVEQAGFEKVDGLLADLGVSRYQLTAPDRGFSFMSDGPLDMRMDQTIGTTAADLVNHTDEKTLADLIFQLGEERRARKIARAIVRARPLRSTLHLADVVERAVPRTGRLHPATKTFMALRMAVNDEPGELDRCSNRSGVAEERRAHGGDQFHVQRRPGGEGKVQGAGTLGAGQNPHQTSVAADRRRECVQPGIAQRQAAGAGNDLSPTRGAEVSKKTMATLPAFFKKNEATRQSRGTWMPRPDHPAAPGARSLPVARPAARAPLPL
jgi:16S rRNA (cytosine1402-N4)-methyltransferase